MAIWDLEKKAKDVGETIGESAVVKAKEVSKETGIDTLKKITPVLAMAAVYFWFTRRDCLTMETPFGKIIFF